MSSSNQVLLNNLTFLQNLSRVSTKAVTSTWTNAQTALESIIPAPAATADSLITAYLATFNASGTPLPSTFTGFLNGFLTYAQNNGYSSAALPTSPPPLQQFTTDYENFLNSQGGDWSLIVPAPTTTDMETQFQSWYASFVANYPYSSTNGSVGDVTDFFNNAAVDLTTTAALTTGSVLTDSNGNVISPDTYPRYDALYNVLFPNGNFADRLNQFYQQEVATKGYFNPSQDISDWTQEISTEYAQSAGLNPIYGPSSLSSSNFDKTLILNTIYSLVASMMNTMQSVTAAQANRLFTLTQWQNAYTDAISQLHVFLQSDGSPLSDTGVFTDADAKSAVRTELNDYLNSNFRQNMQAYQSAVGDDAKALQSNLNQSNDAVSQQANMATAIIQELTTILTAIIPPP
jgi:hypothetical protein